MKTFFALLICCLCSVQLTFAQTTPIKIKKLSNKPIVEAKVNGKKAYFLLDTGSDITVMHNKKAQHYDFNIKNLDDPRKIAGIHGEQVKMNRAYGIALELGAFPIMVPFYTYDLSAVIMAIHKKNLVKISGIIGSDVMVKYGFVIDYKEELVYMENTELLNMAKASYK